MAKKRPEYKVFLSHASADIWVARQIASHIRRRCRASYFLDESHIAGGDDFEARILKAARESHELLILLTPWSITRPYLWMEVGLFWESRKRIVALYTGFTAREIAADDRIPARLKRSDLVNLNEIDSYLSELAGRVRVWSRGHGSQG